MTETASRRRRRWPFLLAALIIAIVAVSWIGWSHRTSVAERAARTALSFAGLGEDLRFRVTALESDYLRLEDVHYGENGPSAEAAEISFRPGALMEGRFETIRLIGPSITLVERADGSIAVLGVDDDDEPTAESVGVGDAVAASFPKLPNVDRVEIVDGRVRIETSDLAGDASLAATIERTGDRLTADIQAGLVEDTGREAAAALDGAEIEYGPNRIRVVGPLDAHVRDPARHIDAAAAIWADITLANTDAVDFDAIVMTGRARRGGDISFEEMRGRAVGRLDVDGRLSGHADVNLYAVDAPPVSIEFGALAGDFDDGAVRLAVDAVGPSGYIALTTDMPQPMGVVASKMTGEIDAALISELTDQATAAGRVRFDIQAAADAAAMLTDPALRHIEGRANLVVETPTLAVADIAPEGSARGEFDLALSGGGVTVTSPGLLVGGVVLPPETLASLPPDVRRAFQDPAFVRLGGPGLGATAATVYPRPEGGFALSGKLGVGLSNPNLAVFFEGDASLATDATGGLAALRSELLTVRLVDAAFGAATVSGRVDLANVNGAGLQIDADATMALSARGTIDGHSIRQAEIDLAGPLEIGPGAVILKPEPGGRILLNGVSGPVMRSLDPVRLTLTRSGGQRIVYYRATDTLEADLDFSGFKARALMNPDDGASQVDLALKGAGLRYNADGLVFRLNDLSAVLPEYEVALERANARIALGARRAQSGRLTIGQIRHLAEAPLVPPASLELDVRGVGDQLTFQGALIAARDRARLTVKGAHNLATGVGEAALSLGPVVFAPDVLQPRDFVPSLYRTIIEAFGEAKAEADLAWTPKGLIRETARIDLAVDKLTTDDITIEALSTTFDFDRLFPPRSAGPQRMRVGRIDVGVPLAQGVANVNIVKPEQIEIEIEQFDMFGGFIRGQKLTIDPTRQAFDVVLEVSGIDLAQILAFAEFGELNATGKLHGRIPLHYEGGNLRMNDGLLRTGEGGGRLQYRPREIDEALKEVDRSASLAIRALANFVYDEITIRINEIENEELRLDIFINGKSVDVFGGVPFQFNIVIEGPIRQIIEDNLAPIELPPDVTDLLQRGERIVPPPPPQPAQ